MKEFRLEHITEEDVHAMQKARAEAMINSDIEALDTLLSDELMHIHGGGTVQDKKAFIDRRKDPNGIRYKVLDYYDVEVKLFPDSALVRGNLDVLEMIPDRGDVEARVRFSNLWCREKDGVWRCIHSQSSNRTAKGAQ